MHRRFAISISILLCLAFAASGVVTDLVATIDGAQANAGAGSGSGATGSATMTYDSGTGEFSWNITWSGLSGAPTAAHFHGAALSNQNAGVQVDIGGISGLVSPSIGSTFIAPAQAADLLNELWYINVHTADHPAGEIRGQVLVSDIVSNEERSWASVKSLYR